MCITELQGLVTNGLWDPAEDECRSHMKTKLSTVGLKLPKISIQGHCSDVAPGERVQLTVTLTRLHAHTPSEMATLMAATESESADEQQSAADAADADAAVADADAPQSLAAAFGGERAALGKEGWWLVVESLRGHLNLSRAGMSPNEPVHNTMVGRQALSPSLDDPQWCADIEFDAPTTPGEYKIVIHVRSSTMIGAPPTSCRPRAALVPPRPPPPRHRVPAEATPHPLTARPTAWCARRRRREAQAVLLCVFVQGEALTAFVVVTLVHRGDGHSMRNGHSRDGGHGRGHRRDRSWRRRDRRRVRRRRALEA